MDGTNKIVEDIIKQFIDDVQKIEKIDTAFVKKLSDILNDDKAVTAAKIEQALYEEIPPL